MNRSVRRVIFLVALWLGTAGVLRAAEILTNDGQRFKGKVLEETATDYLMEIENGVQVRIGKDQVAHFDAAEAPKESLKTYPVLGLTYGTPSVVNLVAGYYLDDFGLKLSGAYWSGVHGLQADLSWKAVDNEKVLVDFSLVGGTVHTAGGSNGFSLWSSGDWSGTDWTYGGLGFDVNYGGFFFEVMGVTGNFPNPVAFPYQIGLEERFN
ncbi:MAG TPA: hypothetical protein VHE12_09695 [bacterium]|nr:hypothetical protein [bacterium]